MLRIDHDSNAMRIQVLPDALCDLGGQALLNLQPLGKTVQHACKLRDAHHPVTGQVGNGCLPDNRRHVMLAMGLKRYVLEQDNFIIAANLFERARQMQARVFAIPAAIFPPGTADTARRIQKALPIGIITCSAPERPDGVLHVMRNGKFSVFANGFKIMRLVIHSTAFRRDQF